MTAKLAIAASFCLFHCTPSSLTGSNNKKPDPSPLPIPTVYQPPVLPQYYPSPNAPCIEQGITAVTLQQTTIRNNQPNQTLPYLANVFYCNNQTVNLVSFDLNAQVSSEQLSQPITFRLLDPNRIPLKDSTGNPITGQLQAKDGDLFDHPTDPNYRHHESSVSIPAGLKAVIFEIDVSNKKFLPPDYKFGSPEPDSATIDSFFRLGTSQTGTATRQVTVLKQ